MQVRPNNKVRLAAVLAAIVLAATAGFISSSDAALTADSQGVQLRVGVPYPISNLDPTRTLEPYQVLGLGLEQLVHISPEGKLVPWLAQRVSQPGPAVYVYHLRRGVKFSDGSELTAADAANALNYYRNPTSQQSVYFQSVKTITARDRYTVVVTLKHRDASWPAKLAVVAGIFEKKQQDANKLSFGKPGTLLIGTGPWKFDSVNPTSGAELSANPYYRGGRPSIQRISIKFFSDETNEALAFRAGQIDLAFPSVVKAFAAAANTRVVTVPSPQTILLTLNTIESPWKDVHVRRAVAYAINRAGIVAAYGSAIPLKGAQITTPASLGTLGSKAEVNALLNALPAYAHNLQRARQELAQSAYPNGFSANFNTLAGYGFSDMAQVVAAQLKEIGINLKVNAMPVPAWLALVLGAQRDKLGIQFLLASSGILDPSDVPGAVLGSKNAAANHFNYANYGPPDVDGLLTQSIATVAPKKRLAVYGQILKRLSTDVPYLAIATATDNMAISSKFKWPNFNGNLRWNTWALDIKPA
jgi:peptide/nickel transport system substrate-binding protein